MSGDIIWLLAGLGEASLLIAWGSRRFDVKELVRADGSSEPEEPCWTEEISSEGRLSCGRGQCYDKKLSELDARGERGEFYTSA